ncbi:UDP-glucose 6-dehydrogenase [Brevibacillus reuszeri]|uniref:UDP-glucose 6-dehydrogenase n=1 Tax=Brevibacillus reuszeri TaxID=54915 RepID=A0A0K9YQM2_9BACL|nr:UDP-glucose/GDP-mannose dehydrogenase family protein [Brevibacillus reuszeri]KNB71024.1 UDP-glucose 6-dehydrogenase [Brevibacillus reuszeri]MED1857442.1 UDP-glucose/GDP-mannose dehydrogenase family protein [Brevibacillus reuszeri]GED66728.1 UDP-glucose 6-dehydrogenase [Brevibacillus reuszeri]
MKVAVIGTGYVGLTTAVSLAMYGHEVVGIDLVEAKIAMLKQGLSPIYEPGLEKALVQVLQQGILTFSTDLKDAKDSEVLFVCVGTPEATDGTADLSYLLASISDIGVLHNNNPMVRTAVIKSTVPVGTGDRVAALLEDGQSLFVVSNPEFLREGNALADALKPSRIVIGANHQAARAVMERLYEGVAAPRVITTRANAELIKYASNAFLATRISFMNELSRLSTVLGTDILTVAQGMGLDSRIGPEFLRAGVGYGGSCFPKDTIALLQLAQEKGVSLSLLDKVREVNRSQPVWFMQQVRKHIPELKDKQIALLGLAFKPDTDDIREAPSLTIIEELKKSGAEIRAYDPIAAPAVQKLHPEVTYFDTPEEACKGAHAALLITEWKECIQLPWSVIHANMAQPALFDGRNAWPMNEVREAGFHYTGVGRS